MKINKKNIPELAAKLIQSGELDAAEKLCRAGWRFAHLRHDIAILLGLIFSRRDATGRADQLFQTAIAHAPQHSLVYAYRADALLSQGCFAEAYKAARRAHDISPASGDVQKLYGSSLFALHGHKRFSEEFSVNSPALPEWADSLMSVAKAVDRADTRMPSILINALPRSSSTFIRNSISDSFGHVNILPAYHTPGNYFGDLIPSVFSTMRLGGVIARVHLDCSPTNIRLLQSGIISKAVLLLRDPRSAFFSFYHRVRYAPRTDDEYQNVLVGNPDLQNATTEESEIEILARSYYTDTVDWISSWLTHISVDESIEWKLCFYEDFVKDNRATLDSIAGFYGLEASKVVIPAKTTENNYVFGGRSDWKSRFGSRIVNDLNAVMQSRLPPWLVDRWTA